MIELYAWGIVTPLLAAVAALVAGCIRARPRLDPLDVVAGGCIVTAVIMTALYGLATW